MTGGGTSSVDRVRAALEAAVIEARIVRFDRSTRTAEEAASAIGCTVAQIAKSLVFRTAVSDRPVLIVASGPNLVDTVVVAEATRDLLGGEALGRADAGWVRERTGFAIGGVAPVGHREAPVTLIDNALMALPEIWAAAGTPNAVVRLTPAELHSLTGGRVIPVA